VANRSSGKRGYGENDNINNIVCAGGIFMENLRAWVAEHIRRSIWCCAGAYSRHRRVSNAYRARSHVRCWSHGAGIALLEGVAFSAPAQSYCLAVMHLPLLSDAAWRSAGESSQ